MNSQLNSDVLGKAALKKSEKIDRELMENIKSDLSNFYAKNPHVTPPSTMKQAS